MPSLIEFFALMWERILFHAGHTLYAVLLTLILSLAITAISIIPLSYSVRYRFYVQPVFILLQAVPTFILTPLMVLFLGFSIWSIALPTACMLAIPLSLSFMRGLDETPPSLSQFYTDHKLPRWYYFFYVQIPHAVPSLLAGMRNASSSALFGVLAAEWVGGSGGLGVFLQEARRNFDLAAVVGLTITIALVSCFFFYGVLWLERRVLSFFCR